MKHICALILLICSFATAPAVAKEQADSLLTERLVRKLHINDPDSCLRLLDRAEKRDIPSNIAPHRIDILRAMCYEIKGDLRAKEQCCRRALQNDSVRLVPGRRLSATVMLAGILERLNKYDEGIVVCREAVDLARESGNKKDEADVLLTMARTYLGMKEVKSGFACFERAVGLLESAGDVREMATLSTIYGEYMTVLIAMDRTSEAIEMGRRREAVIKRMSELPGPPPGYIDQQYGFLYAKMAVLLFKDGKKQEADEVYRKYQQLSFAQTITGKQFGIPYLLDAGRYREAVEQNDACVSAFANDTVSYGYLGLLGYYAQAYRGMKRYNIADAYMQRCFALQDSIYTREKESKAQEYASIFRTKEKDLQLSEARAVSKQRAILMAASCIVALVLIVLLVVIWKNLNKTKQRNRIAVGQINELLAQREELRKAFAQAMPAARPNETENLQGQDEAGQPGYEEFMRMESVLVGEKLFLQSKFGRDELLRATGVSKNALVGLLRAYAGSSNLNDYLNKLRAEYAVKVMKENPHLTIDAIAEASGFNSRSTFYRIFVKIWGMTPTQYLQTQYGK